MLAILFGNEKEVSTRIFTGSESEKEVSALLFKASATEKEISTHIFEASGNEKEISKYIFPNSIAENFPIWKLYLGNRSNQASSFNAKLKHILGVCFLLNFHDFGRKRRA